MNKILSSLVLLMILASCGTKFSLQKRRYTKGFYFANHHTVSNKTPIAKREADKSTVNKKQSEPEVEWTYANSLIEENSELTANNTKPLISSLKREIKKAAAQPLAIKKNAEQFESFAAQTQLQKHEITKKQIAEKRGILSKVFRFLLSFIGGWLIGIGVVIFLGGSAIGDPTITALATSLIVLGVIFIILAFVIKVT